MKTLHRRWETLLLGSVLVAVVISSCGDESAEPVFDAEYTDWERTVDGPLTYPIPGHGAKRRGIFINETGTNVSVETVDGEVRYEYPPGTIIVKENYSDLEGTTLENLTVMIKAPEDERSIRGWIWINEDIDSGTETVFNENRFCIDCHGAANDEHPYGDGNPNAEFRDFVFFPYIPASE